MTRPVDMQVVIAQSLYASRLNESMQHGIPNGTQIINVVTREEKDMKTANVNRKTKVAKIGKEPEKNKKKKKKPHSTSLIDVIA